ncbi:MAG: hypothetical protein LUE94_05580, partial [Clostridiales bacterium]|nr:hypothetical protein [Clostridiales bacterium]
MSVFSSIKHIVNSGKPANAEEMFNKISNYMVISFDIFDTLLKRNIQSPKDVFDYMESLLVGQYTGFAEKRVAAERLARKKTIEKEVSIQDIYK